MYVSSPEILEVLLEIRQDMSREADYDVDLFAEMVRSGKFSDVEENSDFRIKSIEISEQLTTDN